MITNVHVEKQGNENTTSLIRRFTKKVQGSGVLRKARATRFYERTRSKLVKKKRALNALGKREEREKLIKLGKISDKPTRHHRR